MPRATAVATALNKTIGKKILSLRLQRDYTQESLGKELGVTFQQVQKYERGKNGLSVNQLLRICDVLGVTPHHLLGYDEKDADPESVLHNKGPRESDYDRLVAVHGKNGIDLVNRLCEVSPRRIAAMLEFFEERSELVESQPWPTRKQA